MCLKRIINPFIVIKPKYLIIKGTLLQWRVLSRFSGFLLQSKDWGCLGWQIYNDPSVIVSVTETDLDKRGTLCTKAFKHHQI